MQPLWKSKQKDNYLGGNYYEAQFLEDAHYLLLIRKINLSPPFTLLRLLLHDLYPYGPQPSMDKG